jgi:hypothetical protein
MLALAGCMRPTGDFGRASNSVLHDEVMPFLGKARAKGAKEPVSDFNLADEETEMRDRVWRYLLAPHAKDWFFDTAAELERTRLTPAGKFSFDENLYYRWLTSKRFASSRTRYNRIDDDVAADIATMPTAFAAICAVQGMDRQREVAADGLDGLEPKVRQDARNRKAENRMVIGWFSRSVRYRYEAYGSALDHLLVETPHEQAVNVNAKLTALASYAEAAERDDYCTYDSGAARGGQVSPLRSRYLSTALDEGPYRK